MAPLAPFVYPDFTQELVRWLAKDAPRAAERAAERSGGCMRRWLHHEYLRAA